MQTATSAFILLLHVPACWLISRLPIGEYKGTDAIEQDYTVSGHNLHNIVLWGLGLLGYYGNKLNIYAYT